MTKGRLRLTVLPQVWHERPKTRGDCVDMPRPCPWLFCRHHLALETLEQRRNLKAKGKRRLPEDMDEFVDEAMDMPETCTLDVAQSGPSDLDEVGELLGVSYVAVQMAESRAMKRALATCVRKGIEPHTFADHLVQRIRR